MVVYALSSTSATSEAGLEKLYWNTVVTRRFAFGQRLDRFVDLFEGEVLSERCIYFCCDTGTLSQQRA
jgi:hypothetical protein